MNDTAITPPKRSRGRPRKPDAKPPVERMKASRARQAEAVKSLREQGYVATTLLMQKAQAAAIYQLAKDSGLHMNHFLALVAGEVLMRPLELYHALPADKRSAVAALDPDLQPIDRAITRLRKEHE